MNKIQAAMAILLLSSSRALADVDECNAAVDQYNNAVESLSSAMRRYAQCVDDSKAKDDCSSEFSRLKSDQSDFEAAVSAYSSDCG